MENGQGDQVTGKNQVTENNVSWNREIVYR